MASGCVAPMANMTCSLLWCCIHLLGSGADPAFAKGGVGSVMRVWGQSQRGLSALGRGSAPCSWKPFVQLHTKRGQ